MKKTTLEIHVADGTWAYAQEIAGDAGSASLAVDVLYQEPAQLEATEGKEEPDTPTMVERSLRLLITRAGVVKHEFVRLYDDALEINLLRADGSIASSSTVWVKGDPIVHEITQEQVKARVSDRLPVPTTPVRLPRKAQFIAMGSVRPDFRSARLGVVPVGTWNEAKLLGDGPMGAFGFSVERTSSTEVLDPDQVRLAIVQWKETELGLDGRFIAELELPESVHQAAAEDPKQRKHALRGWLWWLAGDRPAVGFVKDTDLVPKADVQLIPLPAMQALEPQDSADDCGCNGPGNPPRNVSESDLLNVDNEFSEDPGSFCKPFNNPERIVSERSFMVVSRIGQPEISASASANTFSPAPVQLELDEVYNVHLVPVQMRALAATKIAPLGAIRGLSDLIDRNTFTKQAGDRLHRTLRNMANVRSEVSSTKPIQWEDSIARYQASSVVLGHLLDFRVRTRSAGYSLGSVASTLTLAPRQTKRIQKVEFERMERARRSESASQTDAVSDEVTRERDIEDHVESYLSEWASGSSSSTNAAAAAGIGFAMGPVVVGGGGGVSKSWSESTQEGNRQVSASEQQRLRDSIRRKGDAIRRAQSTVVTEVTQQESVTGTTEVLRNPNYGHSLTVIYYQILRHLRVSTEFAGARECFFVPFSIKPFDMARAYRWREALSKNMRSPKFKGAFKYLRDVMTSFDASDIPMGTRAEQVLDHVHGSIHLRLSIERPADGGDGAFNDSGWKALAPYLGSPALSIWNGLKKAVAEERDRQFQREHAPGIAARWTNKLTLASKNGNDLEADMTLATDYSFGGTVRVDFTIPAKNTEALTRNDLVNLRIGTHVGLPAGSVANVTGLTLHFGNAQYSRSIKARSSVNDLISSYTGLKNDGAEMLLPLDAWDRVNEQERAAKEVAELIDHLNEHMEFYHKCIWWSMDRDRLFMMLDGFYAPGTRTSLASLVERDPIAIVGNSLVYRVGAGAFIGHDNIKTPSDLYAHYMQREPAQDDMRLSLPTAGLYAQTIMDECVALEEHLGSRDWVLNDPDPELGSIDPSLMGSRRTDVSGTLTPTPMPSTIINLQNAPDAPAPNGLAGVLNAVTNGDAFRDMAGLTGTQQNAAAAFQAAVGMASGFGNQAAAMRMSEIAEMGQAQRSANQQVASVRKALDEGLITQAEANTHTNGILGRMHAPTPPAAPHKSDQAVELMKAAVGKPNTKVEASTPEGTFSVQTGPDLKDATAKPVLSLTPATGTAENRSFNPARSDISARIELEVSATHAPADARFSWIVDDPKAVTIERPNSARTGIRGLRPGRTDVRCVMTSASGGAPVSLVVELVVPQFIRITRIDAELDAALDNYHIKHLRDRVFTEARNTTAHLLATTNVRTVWQVGPFNDVVPAHVDPDHVVVATYRNDPADGGDHAGLLGVTRSASGRFGIAEPGETITLYLGAYDDQPNAGVDYDADVETRALALQFASAAAPDPGMDDLATKAFGRLFGETLAHEIIHAVIATAPGPGGHNEPAIAHDLMNRGDRRSFTQRTGLVDTAQVSPIDPASFEDRGIAAIGGLTMRNQVLINAVLPVPPAF